MPRAAAIPDMRTSERDARNARLPETVRCRVLEKGDGLVFTGDLSAPVGGVPLAFEAGEEFDCAKETALIHEERGYVEILRSK